jgi:hypothetical protein
MRINPLSSGNTLLQSIRSRSIRKDINAEYNGFKGIKVDLYSSSEPELHLYSAEGFRHPEKDSVDLNNPSGRSLGDSIVHEYYNIPEINEELHSVLDGMDGSVKASTLEIIKNIHADENANTPLERKKMIEQAKAQAKAIAGYFMNEEQAGVYLNAIDDIIGIADKSKYGLKLVGYTSLDKGGAAVYRPADAPEGYVPAGAVFKMFFSPDMYDRYKENIANPTKDPKLDAYVESFMQDMAAYQKKAYSELQKNLAAVEAALL